MDLIFSNIPPLRFSGKDMLATIEDLFAESDGAIIASGYVSADSLADLKNIIDINKKKILLLIIGMHGFEGFSRPQHEAAKYLDDYLRSNQIGEVRVATTFKFHGKMYCFLKGKNPIATIIGSSNLNSIFDPYNVYEADILLHESDVVNNTNKFLEELFQKACTPLKDLKYIRFIETINPLLEGHEGAERANSEELGKIMFKRTGISFKIPIKSDKEAPHSNLNAYFGKGREDKKGFVKPRHWYEVELIVPKRITSNPAYPKAGYPKESVITAYTDDGWKFKCKISGQNDKNFRSADDLKILGRWIKGRLENKGVLKVGQPVTDKVLKDYGRDNFDLIGTKDPSIWLLNFEV